MQHPSTTVLHETFADPFYFGPDAKVREEDKAADDAIESSGLARDKTYAGVVEEIMGAMSDGKRVFTKELSTFWQKEKLANNMEMFTHTFLIRHPEKILRSYLRLQKKEGKTTFFDVNEVAYKELLEIATMVKASGKELIVVDADDLLAKPQAVMGKWCEMVGLEFHEDLMTKWEPSKPKMWDKWDGWHEDAAKSQGFKAPVHGDEQEELPDFVKEALEEFMVLYTSLYDQRIKV
ncbi:hypothetical protein TrCOL_g12862 [Triparma columacea]|uniref:Sulfotransferase n=1 Tax=Triparma columacea TaxID=722753 RepID=A0A9W7GBR3_9STRA|nr:hypothetical protein TrCOL_g12862 [Triparma columacea]